jgi:hypothetical protein
MSSVSNSPGPEVKLLANVFQYDWLTRVAVFQHALGNVVAGACNRRGG